MAIVLLHHHHTGAEEDAGFSATPRLRHPALAHFPRAPGVGPQCVSDPAATPQHLKRSVMLLGNFDGFHLGHQALLAEARRRATAASLPLGVMSVEPHPRQLFEPEGAPSRLTTPAIKLETFERLGFDLVFNPVFNHAFAGQSAERFIVDVLVAGLEVSWVVVGEDFRFGNKRRGDVGLLRQFGSELGFGVLVVGRVNHDGANCSSSHIRHHLRTGDIAGANSLLGYPWPVEIRLKSKSVQRADSWWVEWPKSVLRPAIGCYPVTVRQVNGAAPMARGVINMANDGVVEMLLARRHRPPHTDSGEAPFDSPIVVEVMSQAAPWNQSRPASCLASARLVRAAAHSATMRG